MSKVFITQVDPSRDYSQAAKYGEIVPICTRDDEIWPDRMLESSSKAREKIDAALQNFDFRTDFILLSGDPMIIAMVSMIVEEMNFEGLSVSFLKYTNSVRDYFVVEV